MDDDRSEHDLRAALGLPQEGDTETPAQCCDFCEKDPKRKPPRWYYPTGSVVDYGTFAVNMGNLVGGGWLACDDCHGFLAQDDYAGLARHMGYEVGPDDELPRCAVTIFRDQRLGPAQPYAG